MDAANLKQQRAQLNQQLQAAGNDQQKKQQLEQQIRDLDAQIQTAESAGSGEGQARNA